MTDYVKKLPAVFQTVTEKKFFDSTFDQVFSKKDSDQIFGYIGRRKPGLYNPVNDFYVPEPSKDRTWWQLEATAFARNEDSTKSNIFFYDDLLNRLNYYGGNTLNQDRLFESEFYSWAPPIDFDMFINYQNYYWIESGLIAINITGLTDAEITAINGQSSYTITKIGATPAGLTLTTGMKLQFIGSTQYPEPLTVENIGGCVGIRLVNQAPDYTSGTTFEFLPLDGTIQLANNRIINNTNWDTLTWDVEPQPSNGDYITIERGSVDENAWSRTNSWYHIDAINSTVAVTGIAFPSAAARALRPIIQFSADLILYNSGTQFKTDISYGFRGDTFGLPLLLSQFQSQPSIYIETALNIQLQEGQLCVFMLDPANEQTVFYISINTLTDIVTFVPVGTPAVNNDIVFATATAPFNGVVRGQTWYYNANAWSAAVNDKITTNQAPLFQLFDHNGIPLDDAITYPKSTFNGSKIFSYQLNTNPGAVIDPVLNFPIVYNSLGQATDIIFQNDLITDRYVYSDAGLLISGYYYYRTAGTPVYYNNWNIYTPGICTDEVSPAPSKQRVIDKYVVGYGTQYQFKLSVEPAGYPSAPDIVVSVNGSEIKESSLTNINGYVITVINNSIYVDLQLYLTALFTVPQAVPPVVEIDTYTYGLLDPAATGYFSIPQQLEANPTQEEVGLVSASDLIQQFSSIIESQAGIVGPAFGGPNNYRDSGKNRSLGAFILQNVSPALKSMLISSSNDLDFITGVRFSQDEYTKFKNKYLKTAQQLIDQEFNPVQYHNNTIVISAWVDAIIKTVNVSKEFSSAFAYSYMIANGTPYLSETQVVPLGGLVTLANYVDLSDQRNALYVYDTTGQETLLMVGVDYEIVSTNLAIDIQFNTSVFPGYTSSTGATSVGTIVNVSSTAGLTAGMNISVQAGAGSFPSNTVVTNIISPTSFSVSAEPTSALSSTTTVIHANSICCVALYKNPLPAYIPSTPTKVGSYGTFIPRIELDTSYTIPTNVIIGHDGSKTIAYGDYRDSLLLELEKRIYNLLQFKFRNEYYLPLRLESIKSGYYRQTRYTRNEYLDITESYLNKWSAKNRANYRVNDWATASADLPHNSPELWKLYNYATAVTSLGAPLNLPGNWKGIFQYYYDTIFPDTRPWEMLGFTSMPVWWVTQYGSSWGSTNTALWADLEAGVIRQGPSAIFNPITLQPQPQAMWARPGLSLHIPVDPLGQIVPVPTLFHVATTTNAYAPFDGFKNPWSYGDGGPVEQAWMSTSAYAFSVQEFLYLMKPGPFGELLFDTVGTELSPGTIDVTGVHGPVMSTTNWQYVQNDTYASTDPLFAWMRPKNADQFVHGEIVDSVVQIRYGYQRWISDRILFLGRSVATTFGQKIRTLDVNLANKVAGFTNKDTIATYIESVSTTATTTSLLVPTNNFNVILHKGQPIKTYVYSGVVIRISEDGTFVVYGYDLQNSAFTVLDRSNAQAVDITVGGTPAEFRIYTIGETYTPGEIVRYNGVYYSCIDTIVTAKFDSANWQKLRTLPTIGGVSVVYYPISETTFTTVPYGSVLTSAQEVFDLLIGWGAYLETQGWEFTDVSSDTNQISDWLYSGKQFLFWLNTNWSENASIQLSPSANKVMLTVQTGYPDDVESISNGVYSIMDKYGVAIPPVSTSTNRTGKSISVEPTDLGAGGIYFLQVHASETEHVLIFDNTTSFSDIIYDPLLQVRQQRLRFNGFRSNGWYGKKEAPGYLIIDNQLVPNYDTIVDEMRYYYDPDTTIDNPSIEALGRHLIGYESKSYLDNLQVSNDVQYLFYQGFIRQKGNVQSFHKLFRSAKIMSSETIEIYEEWALKLADFGNTVEQVSTEFKLTPEQNSGEVIVARLNFIPSDIGFVKEIKIINAQNRYTTVPNLVVGPPDISIAGAKQAKAYVVLDANGVISRVDISDPGYGYLTAPLVSINSGSQLHHLDRLYAVWQGEITGDTTLDNIVDIDIDNTDIWTSRPAAPSYSLVFPTTPIIKYATPNAGYVNFNDVTMTSFDVIQTYASWGTSVFNPVIDNTIWVAKTFIEDWDVYKMVNINPSTTNVWHIIEGESGNLILLTDLTTKIVPQLSSVSGSQTDFGSSVCLQNSTISNHIFLVQPSTGSNDSTPWDLPFIYEDPLSSTSYYGYDLLDLAGTPITSSDYGDYASWTDLLLFKTMRFMSTPNVSLYSYITNGDKLWIDDVNGLWNVSTYNASSLTPYRVQSALIDTALFENAQIFDTKSRSELVLLPIYDPFKAILPAPAKQNITYMLLQDPAKYNVTADARLFSENITFGEAQVGKLWWDLSSVRYVYYEQPQAVDELTLDNLTYRRDRWGQVFPGSTFNMYEWTKSPVPPAEYTGTGTPRSTTDYVQLSATNRFTNITVTNYYFWVLNPTDKPNIKNRTMAAVNVANLMATPKSQGFTFFSPIQQTPINNSYMFYNVQEILSYRGNNVQIEYRLATRNDQKHTQWTFFREGDAASVVTSQYWDKMVDSLCGYTMVLPVTDEWSNGILIAANLTWDTYGWDISPWDEATNTYSEIYGTVLPVPDPSLAQDEIYGIKYRPRQTMFADIKSARKIFVQSANNLLKYIPIRDSNPGWDTDVTTSDYWTYTTWYAEGYENVTPTVVFSTLADAQAALTAGALDTGAIAEVINGTADGRYMLYAVVQVNPVVATQSFKNVAIEDSAIKLLTTIYTVSNIYGLSTELRKLLNAFRSEVFINQHIVDQNELYFSLLNYVYSEQKNIDWTFKTSYIYIKQYKIPLVPSTLYIPDQIDNIIGYINDVKPYHTQVRDYTAAYTAIDIAAGTSADTMFSKTTLQFGPDFGGPYEPGHWDADCNDATAPLQWDSQAWDICPDNYAIILDAGTISGNSPQGIDPGLILPVMYNIPLVTFDPSKIGYSQLFPYTFNLNTTDDPQTFMTPSEIVSITIGNATLTYGRDYYVDDNNDGTYTAYFYQDPGSLPVPQAAVLWTGGQLIRFSYGTNRTEIAHGIPTDDFVVNVDTRLPVNTVAGVPHPIAPWGLTDAGVDPFVANLITAAGGVAVYNPATPITLDYLKVGGEYVTISYKQNLGVDYNHLIRNSDASSGILSATLPAPQLVLPTTAYVITVTASSDIFPTPLATIPAMVGAVWIDGERIEYRRKVQIAPNTWELSLLRRGTDGTASSEHVASSVVWVEYPNEFTIAFDPASDYDVVLWDEYEWDSNPFKNSNIAVWNATNTEPDLLTEIINPITGLPMYTDITSASAGGLWYADTLQSAFLKDQPGRSIP